MRQHGVHIRNNEVYAYGNPARYMIDGTFWMPFGEKVPFVPVEMIKRVDIIPAVNTTLFGINRMNRSLPKRIQINSWSVIAITTKDGSELLRSGYRDPDQQYMQVVRPQGYQTPAEFYSPKYETARQRNAPERDLRTTLYWNSALEISPEGRAEIEFYTADEPADYSIRIEGILHNEKYSILHRTIKLE